MHTLKVALHHNGKRLLGTSLYYYYSLAVKSVIPRCLVKLPQQMQARYKAMMDQKVYMNEQLKAIMKRNRVLEVSLHESRYRPRAHNPKTFLIKG